MTVEILTEYKHTWCPLSSMCTFRPRGGPQCIILYSTHCFLKPPGVMSFCVSWFPWKFCKLRDSREKMCFLVEVAFWGVIVLLVWTFLSKVSRTRGGGDTELAGLIHGSESFYIMNVTVDWSIFVFSYNAVEHIVTADAASKGISSLYCYLFTLT